MPSVFRTPPLLTAQVRRPSPAQLMTANSGTVNTTFTASASFQATIDTTFTASVSFVTPGSGSIIGFTASASFVALDTTIAATYWPYPESTEAKYEIRAVGVNGGYVDVIDDYTEMGYTLVMNDVGSLTMTLPGSHPLTYLTPDTRYEIWRKVGFGSMKLEGDTQFVLQERYRTCDRNGTKLIQVVAPTINSILKRRVVPHNDDGTTYVERVDYSENIMKWVVYENFMGGALDAARRIIPSVLTTDPADTAMTSTVGMGYAHKNVADIIKDLANQSFQLGYPLYYDIVATIPPTELTFRPFIARGVDRRASGGGNPIIIGHEHGTMGAYSIKEIYTDEITYVYCAGPGEDDVREVVTVEDVERSGRSPFGRREYWEDYQDGDDTAKLTSRANAILAANRPKKIFEGEILNTGSSLYGVHWGWGDILTAAADGETFDATVATVSVSMKDKDEQISASMRSLT